jgi:putative component of toxin-antitoxin plasmid stabilization module
MPLEELLVFRHESGSVPLDDWLNELRKTDRRAFAKCLERITNLAEFANEVGPPRAKALRDGIWELRARCGSVHYRILFFFCGKAAACLSHGFKKGGKGASESPDAEIEVAIRNRTLVTANRNKHTMDWQVEP